MHIDLLDTSREHPRHQFEKSQFEMKEKVMKPSKATANYADDAPLRPSELATLRPARLLLPQLAELASKRRRARKGEAVKQAVSIRLSPEVIAFYKTKGDGWQTRIDDTLRAIVAATR